MEDGQGVGFFPDPSARCRAGREDSASCLLPRGSQVSITVCSTWGSGEGRLETVHSGREQLGPDPCSQAGPAPPSLPLGIPVTEIPEGELEEG